MANPLFDWLNKWEDQINKEGGQNKAYQTEIYSETLNDAIETRLVEDSREQEQLRNIMN